MIIGYPFFQPLLVFFTNKEKDLTIHCAGSSLVKNTNDGRKWRNNRVINRKALVKTGAFLVY